MLRDRERAERRDYRADSEHPQSVLQNRSGRRSESVPAGGGESVQSVWDFCVPLLDDARGRSGEAARCGFCSCSRTDAQSRFHAAGHWVVHHRDDAFAAVGELGYRGAAAADHYREERHKPAERDSLAESVSLDRPPQPALVGAASRPYEHHHGNRIIVRFIIEQAHHPHRGLDSRARQGAVDPNPSVPREAPDRRAVSRSALQ